MLRHAVLCLLLAFQCTTAIEWEEFRDRIEDHHDDQGLPEQRDDWFWDDHFWRYPHMMRRECPDGYGWEGDYEDGHCEGCEAGHYSASWGPTVRCISCPPGTFQPDSCSDMCHKCPEWRPFSPAGSHSQHDCRKMPNTECGDMTATVGAHIEATGDYTFLNDALEQLSGYGAHEMSGHVMYDDDTDTSTGSVSFVLSRRAAYEAHMYVQDLKTQLPLVNDWIATGHSYVNRIFSMLNLADSLYLLGLKMDPSDIHRLMRNLRVTNIDSKYYENCKANQVYDMQLDADEQPQFPGMTFCQEDTDYSEDTTEQKYVSFTGESKACMTLGGRTRLGHHIENHWEVDGCTPDDGCHKSLMRCEYDHEEKESWLVVYVNKKYGKLSTDWLGLKLFDEHDVEFSVKSFYAGDDCPGGHKDKTTGDGRCNEGCDEHEKVFWRHGRCDGCPFGSYWDEEDNDCHHCDRIDGDKEKDYFISETYMHGSVGASSCIAYHGDYDVIAYDEADLSQKFVRIGRRPFDIPRDNRQHYRVNIEAKLDVCYAVHHKKEYAAFCSDKYDDLESLSFDDFTDFDMTKLSCLAMHRLSDLYDANCEGREFSWPPAENFYWLDAACMVVKHVQQTEEKCPGYYDEEKCAQVDEDIRVLTMPFTLQRGFSNDLDWGSILIPLLEHVDIMTGADFSTVTTAVRGAMKRLGVYETSRLTGLGMTDYLRDLIIELPEHLKMSSGEADLLNDEVDVFCEDGSLKKDCRSACALPYNQCQLYSGDEYELTCFADECNDCQVSYTYRVDGEDEDREYECVNICDGLLYHSDNSFLALITANPDVEGDKLFHYECEEYYRLKNDDVDLADCKDEEHKAYSCNEDGSPIESPTCVDDKCTMPTEGPENGFIKSVRAYANLACRYVEMACNPGYELKGDPICYCDAEGNWPDMPTCEKVECGDDGDSTIENGILVNHLVGTDMSWYRCDVNNPTYDGDMDYFAADTCGESIVCGKHENEHCPPTIEHGYKVREWERKPEEREEGGEREGQEMEHRSWHAEYRCEPKFKLEDNEMFSYDDETHGWAECSEQEGNHLPECVPYDDDDDDDDEMKPCKMPEYTEHGYLVEEFRDEDTGLVTHGTYECDDGYMMVDTIHGEIGFCREWDHSYELPYCMHPDDWHRVEFELVGGYAKMQNAGRVKARYVYSDDTKGDWFTGCDDHFNSPAAASICQTVGFTYGKMIDAPKKMRPIKDVPFGMTNFWCYYDDVLPMSHMCNTEDYGQLGWPLCMPDEQLAVSCFDVWWEVNVKFQMKSRRKNKMFCPVSVEKEGIKMKTKNMGLSVAWGGLKQNKETGEWDNTDFKEGVHYEDRRFSKKKGFRGIFIGNMDDYDCLYCDIHLGDHWLNPRHRHCPSPDDQQN